MAATTIAAGMTNIANRKETDILGSATRLLVSRVPGRQSTAARSRAPTRALGARVYRHDTEVGWNRRPDRPFGLDWTSMSDTDASTRTTADALSPGGAGSVSQELLHL